VINIEKRNQNIRDDILEMNNMNPSYTRQASTEWDRVKTQAAKAPVPNPSKNTWLMPKYKV